MSCVHQHHAPIHPRPPARSRHLLPLAAAMFALASVPLSAQQLIAPKCASGGHQPE